MMNLILDVIRIPIKIIIIKLVDIIDVIITVMKVLI